MTFLRLRGVLVLALALAMGATLARAETMTIAHLIPIPGCCWKPCPTST